MPTSSSAAACDGRPPATSASGGPASRMTAGCSSRVPRDEAQHAHAPGPVAQQAGGLLQQRAPRSRPAATPGRGRAARHPRQRPRRTRPGPTPGHGPLHHGVAGAQRRWPRPGPAPGVRPGGRRRRGRRSLAAAPRPWHRRLRNGWRSRRPARRPAPPAGPGRRATTPRDDRPGRRRRCARRGRDPQIGAGKDAVPGHHPGLAAVHGGDGDPHGVGSADSHNRAVWASTTTPVAPPAIAAAAIAGRCPPAPTRHVGDAQHLLAQHVRTRGPRPPDSARPRPTRPSAPPARAAWSASSERTSATTRHRSRRHRSTSAGSSTTTVPTTSGRSPRSSGQRLETRTPTAAVVRRATMASASRARADEAPRSSTPRAPARAAATTAGGRFAEGCLDPDRVVLAAARLIDDHHDSPVSPWTPGTAALAPPLWTMPGIGARFVDFYVEFCVSC